jgi:hypothetical protein
MKDSERGSAKRRGSPKSIAGLGIQNMPKMGTPDPICNTSIAICFAIAWFRLGSQEEIKRLKSELLPATYGPVRVGR